MLLACKHDRPSIEQLAPTETLQQGTSSAPARVVEADEPSALRRSAAAATNTAGATPTREEP